MWLSIETDSLVSNKENHQNKMEKNGNKIVE